VLVEVLRQAPAVDLGDCNLEDAEAVETKDKGRGAVELEKRLYEFETWEVRRQ
jgi:hypothetical protein